MHWILLDITGKYMGSPNIIYCIVAWDEVSPYEPPDPQNLLFLKVPSTGIGPDGTEIPINNVGDTYIPPVAKK